MKKVRNEQAKGLSLLEMLDEIDHEEEPERPIQKNQLKMGIEDIMKDTDAFHQEKKKETMARERKKIEPSFNDGLILHFDKKPEEQKGYHHGFEDVEKEWKSYCHIYLVSKRKRSKGRISMKAIPSCLPSRSQRRLVVNSIKEVETTNTSRICQRNQSKDLE